MRRWISSIIMVLLIMLTTFLTSCGRTETPQVESNQSSHSNQEDEENQEEAVVRDDQPAGKNLIEQLQLTDRDADGNLYYRKSNSQTGDVEELIYKYK